MSTKWVRAGYVNKTQLWRHATDAEAKFVSDVNKECDMNFAVHQIDLAEHELQTKKDD